MQTTLNSALNTFHRRIHPYHSTRAQEEEEAWKRVSYHYDTYIKLQQECLAKRIARMTPSSTPAPDDSQPMTPSAKAESKHRDVTPNRRLRWVQPPRLGVLRASSAA